MNAKNDLKEFLEARGLSPSLASYRHTPGIGGWTSTVEVALPGRAPVTGTGTASRKTQADILASADVLPTLSAATEEDVRHWVPITAEAQAGDALIKLAGYLAIGSPEDRSLWLQEHESDEALARLFDRWHAAGAPELAAYGTGLGTKYKATLVEAIVWRRFGARVLGPAAQDALRDLRGLVG